MATAEQLKALLKSFSAGDEDRFYAVAMQVAAHSARQGHGKLAQEMRELIDEAKAKGGPPRRGERSPVPVVQPRGELAGLLSVSYPKTRLADMVLEPKLHARLERILLEQRQREKLLVHGLTPRRKILLVGPPGTGKTGHAPRRLAAARRGHARAELRRNRARVRGRGEGRGAE